MVCNRWLGRFFRLLRFGRTPRFADVGPLLFTRHVYWYSKTDALSWKHVAPFVDELYKSLTLWRDSEVDVGKAQSK